MDALTVVAVILLVILLAVLVLILRNEFHIGGQNLLDIIRDRKITSAGCCYYPEEGELELAEEFGGKTVKMRVLDDDFIRSVSNGGVFAVYLKDGRVDESENIMVSEKPINMEAARAIMAASGPRGTNGVINLYTYKEDDALYIAGGDPECVPVLHASEEVRGFKHYHRFVRDTESGPERSPRIFFGNRV